MPLVVSRCNSATRMTKFQTDFARSKLRSMKAPRHQNPGRKRRSYRDRTGPESWLSVDNTRLLQLKPRERAVIGDCGQKIRLYRHCSRKRPSSVPIAEMLRIYCLAQ